MRKKEAPKLMERRRPPWRWEAAGGTGPDWFHGRADVIAIRDGGSGPQYGQAEPPVGHADAGRQAL